MSPIRGLRAWHALLAGLVVLTYVTGDFGSLHAWLGYAIAALIPLRLIAALTDLLMLAVGLHIAYLLLAKRPLARFMLFLDAGGRR